MTTEAKFVTAGCTAGVAAASLPIIYGTVKNLIPKPLDENDFLHTENGLFTAANGNIICLRGFNMNDELFFFKKDKNAENLKFSAFFIMFVCEFHQQCYLIHH